MQIFKIQRGRSLVSWGLFCFLWVSGSCRAQEASPKTSPDAISSLNARIEALEKGQQQMSERLDAISKLLGGRAATSAAPVPNSINIKSEPFIGERNAPVAIVEFADFECPYCGQFARDTYPKFLDNYVKTGRVAFFFHDFPSSAHPHAEGAAEAARCAEDQNKYWEMHDALFAHQNALSAPAITSYAEQLGMDTGKLTACVSSGRYAADIQKSFAQAQELGVPATPSFFIGTMQPGGNEMRIVRALRGAYNYEAFKAVLDRVLAQATADKSDDKH